MGGSCCTVERQILEQNEPTIASRETIRKQNIIFTPKIQKQPSQQNKLEPITLSVLDLKEIQDYCPNDLTDAENIQEQQSQDHQKKKIDKYNQETTSTPYLGSPGEAIINLPIELPSFKKLQDSNQVKIVLVRSMEGSSRELHINPNIIIQSAGNSVEKMERQVTTPDGSHNKSSKQSNKKRPLMMYDSPCRGQDDNQSMRSNNTKKSNLKKGKFQICSENALQSKSNFTNHSGSCRSKKVRFEVDAQKRFNHQQSSKKK